MDGRAVVRLGEVWMLTTDFKEQESESIVLVLEGKRPHPNKRDVMLETLTLYANHVTPSVDGTIEWWNERWFLSSDRSRRIA